MIYRLVLDSGPLEWALAAAGAAAFAAAWPSVRRLPRGLAALRISAALLLVAALLKPVVHRLEERYALPKLAVLLDLGPGMRARDDQRTSRLDRAVRWLKANRAAIEDRAEVSLLGASGGARRLDWDDLDKLKPGAAALEPASVFSDVADSGALPKRLWLLSDGSFDPGDAMAPALRRLQAPVDTLGVGPHKDVRSVSITGLKTPDFVFLHSRFPVSATVEANSIAGRPVTVSLWKEDSLVGTLTRRAASQYDVFRVTFTVEATSLGRQAFRFTAVSPREAERKEKALRTSREFGVEVIRQKYRIMYLAGRPSTEYSHLRAQLKGDPNHELVSFVILRNPENVAPVPDNELSLIPFPATEIFVKSLFQFDLFILENFAYRRFHLPKSYLENLKRFVQQGGALLVIGGSSAFTRGGYQGTPLEETLPVKLWPRSDDFKPGLFGPVVAAPDHPLLRLGDTPESSAALWRSLPPLDGYSRFTSVRPGASVLLSHPTEKTASGQPIPVVAVREFGRGKVMLVGTDSTWRWKLGGGLNWKVSSFYGRFWRRAVEYLTGSLELKKVKFSPLPDRMPPREPAVLSLHVFDEHFRPVPGSDLDIRLVWTDGGKKRRSPPFFEREPGVFQIELNDLGEGSHSVRALVRYRGQLWGDDTARFRWEHTAGRAPLNRKRLKALSDRTGGRYGDLHRVDAADRLAALPPPRRKRSVLGRTALWSWSGWLWALCGALLLEWLFRRMRGYL